nr:hypothetical protein [Candidatus Sigynarchaeota archaeon]
MAYAPMDSGSFPILPTYLGVAAFCMVMTVLLLNRWRERRTRPPKLLFFAFLSYLTCIVMLAAGFAEVVATGFKMELYRFSLAFGFAGIMASNCFLILFAADLFSLNVKHAYVYIAIDLITSVLLTLPVNHYGWIGTEIQGFNLRPYSFGAMMFFSIVIYLRIGWHAFHVSKSVDDRVGKAGFAFIGWSQVCLILFFLFIGLDMIVIAATDATGYTVFNFLGWTCGAFFFLCSYLGLIMPGWLKNGLEHAKRKKK